VGGEVGRASPDARSTAAGPRGSASVESLSRSAYSSTEAYVGLSGIAGAHLHALIACLTVSTWLVTSLEGSCEGIVEE